MPTEDFAENEPVEMSEPEQEQVAAEEDNEPPKWRPMTPMTPTAWKIPRMTMGQTSMETAMTMAVPRMTEGLTMTAVMTRW